VSAGTHDLVGAVETFYAPDLSDQEWLRMVVEKVRPLLDRQGLGIAGALYDCPDPCSWMPSHMFLLDVSEQLQRVLFDGSESLPPVYVADSLLNRTCYLGADVRGWSDISTFRSGAAQEAGIADALQLNVVEPDGQGFWLGSPQTSRVPLPDDLRLTLIRLARHLAAAHRLRRKHPQIRVAPDDAEAVLAHDGKIQHAEGIAQDPTNQTALTRAARTMDAVRTRRTAVDPRECIKDWQSIVVKRWTFLEHFESDGKRFFLAVDNRKKPPSLDLLSGRERDVVLHALRGRDNKAIASDLGLAHSTVRVLLARAAAKVGARSRTELLQAVGATEVPAGR
jgi:DNA-binding NarL/FixJ family response regulator